MSGNWELILFSVAARMAADATMMSHFYSPLHMWGSSLHSRYPGQYEGGDRGAGYPEHKYDPVGEGKVGAGQPHHSLVPPQPRPHSSPGSSPAGVESTAHYPAHPEPQVKINVKK